jgi:hypothetical protein
MRPNNPCSPHWTLRLEDWAKDKNVTVIESGRAANVPAGPIDLAISVTYEKLLKPDWIARCTKAINIHNGPLPEYRGVNPINWALKNKESEHGLTIHEINPGIDDGPILAITRFPINPEVDEVIDVYERCINFGWKLFKELMSNLWTITPQPQDPSRAHYNFILGAEVEEFEVSFAQFIGVTHSVAVGSGLDALRLPLQALGIGEGDEVIVPANTVIASALAVSAVGAKPVLARLIHNEGI